MASLEHTHSDEQVRVQRPEAESTTEEPRADRPDRRLGWASSVGNAAAQRVLRSAVQRSSPGGAVDPEVERQIQSARGGGQSLDAGTEKTMGKALGDDFSDVRVHTDSNAEALNKSVNADAFTTGSDIFFRGGKYSPGGSDGEKLLAHELTHVTQQRGASTSGAMTVSDPGDSSELEAGKFADHATSGATPAAAGVARQEEEEIMPSAHLDRQEEEEEMLQPSPHLDRQEEEEEMMMSPHLDRQEEEEEMLQPSPHLDRQAEEEEDASSMS